MARKKRESKRELKRPKKKVSILDQESVTYVDYKDVELLKRFMSERGKIRARRVTGNTTQQQRQVAQAIKLARELALLPYSVRIATGARGGKRRRRDDERTELRDDMPVPDGPPPGPRTPIAADGREREDEGLDYEGDELDVEEELS